MRKAFPYKDRLRSWRRGRQNPKCPRGIAATLKSLLRTVVLGTLRPTENATGNAASQPAAQPRAQGLEVNAGAAVQL